MEENLPRLQGSTTEETADFIRAGWKRQPVLGIVLGSGSGKIADSIDIEQVFDYDDIPNFPSSTAIGHRGRLVCGSIAGRKLLAFQGRFHPYEGHSFERVTFPIRLFDALGIRSVFITNAAGGLNPRYGVGDLMAIESQIDLMNLTSPRLGPLATTSLDRFITPRTVRRADDASDRGWIDSALRLGRRRDFAIHRGVYAGVLGPNYETRAEIRMLRKCGADVVGMSTVGEIAMAAALGIGVLAISVITNVANPDRLDSTSGQQVIDAAKVAEPHLLSIVQDFVQSIE